MTPGDESLEPMPHRPALGIAVADSPEACAAAVADEVARLLSDGTVRDKATGVRVRYVPAILGILFRSRTSHREFEHELNVRRIPTYVYKGLRVLRRRRDQGSDRAHPLTGGPVIEPAGVAFSALDSSGSPTVPRHART